MENKGDSIVVTDETAAQGTRSLKITDAAGLTHSYNPHYVYNKCNYGEGVVRATFGLRVEKSTRMNHEWRDWSASPYRTGPRFEVRDGKLSVPGEEPMTLPVGEWVRVEIATGVGSKNTGKWSLTVTLPGQAPRAFDDLPHVSGAFKKLNWVGFVSDATAATKFYLDDIKLTNAP